MNNASKAYIITFSGIQFYLLEPKLEDISFTDIAHSHAMQCRWTGHCKYHYSIAQHEVLASYLVPQTGYLPLQTLTHDGSEAYLGDMNRPLKHHTNAGDAYRRVEWPIQNLIYDAAGVPRVESEYVKIADNMMLYTELDQLLPKVNWDTVGNNPQGGSPTAEVLIEEWSPRYAEQRWLERFDELYKRRIN